MLYGDRVDIREQFFTAWQKHLANEMLTKMESQIVQLIKQHPEYHYILQDADTYSTMEFTPQSGGANPFMHFGLHLAIIEQITLDRPQGMTAIYQELTTKYGDSHEAEHQMMQVLAEHIWQTLHHQHPFNENAYIQTLKKL